MAEEINGSVELTSLNAVRDGSQPSLADDRVGTSSDETDSDETSSESASSDRHGCVRPLSRERWPPSFCCPITQEPMHDPVVAMDGHSYESAVISEWLRTHDTSPVNGNRLASKALIRNVALRNAMSEWNELLHNQPNGSPAGAGPPQPRASTVRDDGVVVPEPEPEPESQAEAESGVEIPQQLPWSGQQATTARGPIVFEPQTDWEDLAATHRRRSMRTNGTGTSNHQCLNRVCMLLMMFALGLACYTMYIFSPYDPGPPDCPQDPDPPSTCRDCMINGCCRQPFPPPCEKHLYPPGARSLQRQLFEWDEWEPTRLEDRMAGDGRFTGCEFKRPLPPTSNNTKGNNTRHSYERVNWIETRSAIQACDTDKKSSCIECVGHMG